VSTLKVSPELELPIDTVTKTMGILAQRRKGKTYTANVIAEEMVMAGIPWVALDPTGAWWGLRSSADGKKPGLPVYVFGGAHGDLILERTGGAMIADLVVEQPGYYILDMSAFDSKNAERQFATEFAERFYRLKAKHPSPMHLFVDEADVFAPQQVPGGDQRMLGAFEAIVRRGGSRGIGTTLITQRAAVINKNILEQIDVLILLRTVGPNDRKAVMGYVNANGAPEQQRELEASLASLDLGEAWVWEPGEGLFQRVKIRQRHTFNSSATPEVGTAIAPVKMASIDLDAIRTKMAQTIEKVEQDDPVALRRRIAELEARPATERVVEKTVEVVPDALRVCIDMVISDYQTLGEHIGLLQRHLPDTPLLDLSDVTNDETKPAEPVTNEVTKEPGQLVLEAKAAGDNVAWGTTGAGRSQEPAGLSLAERKILTVLAQYPSGRTLTQVGILAGYATSGGGFRNALGSLRTKGFIEGKDPVQITTDGRLKMTTTGDWEPLPTGRALLDYWLAKLGKAERAILTTVYENYPNEVTPEYIADQTNYAATGGGFRNALGKLRTLELIEGRDRIRAAATLLAGEVR
jgi:hypothetical protein